MTHAKKQLPLILILSLLTVSLLVGCGDQQQAELVAAETVTDVSLIRVDPEAVPDSFEAVGTVRAVRTSQLSSRVLATIVEVRVTEGSRAQAGDVLALLDDAQPRAAFDRARAALAAAEQEVAAAQADFELATSTLRRFQSLYEKKSVSPQEFDEVQTRQRAAQARRDLAQAGQAQARAAMQEAETVLSYTRIRAPFDCLVTERRVDPGTQAAPGMILLVVEDTRRFRLEVSVDESEIGTIQLRQEVPVVIDALGRNELTGRVAQMVPAADPASRTFLVKVDLPRDVRVRSGVYGRARFPRGKRLAIRIPVTAVVERGQLDGVYVVGEDSIARLRYVTLGKQENNHVEVLSGLEARERIVAAPGERDLAGKRIAGGRP